MKQAFNTKYSCIAFAATVLAVLSPIAYAQDMSCIGLKTDGQKQESYKDESGKPATRLVTPGKVLPGDEIVWTITVTNTCNKPVENVVVSNAVPEHMVYVGDSAMGTGTDMKFSLNNHDFLKLNQLTVRDADGKTRAPRADEIKAIRWTYGNAFTANAVGFVRYRAKVK